MFKTLALIAIAFLSNFSLLAAEAVVVKESTLKNGDLIFIESRSRQSAAIKEVTNSEWTHMGVLFKEQNSSLVAESDDGKWMVYEAAGTGVAATLKSFVARTKGPLSIRRIQTGISFEKAQIGYQTAKKILSKFYDIYFTKHNNYCSGYSYAVLKAMSYEVGEFIKISKLKLDGPEAKRILLERFEKREAPFSKEEWKNLLTITPVSIHDSNQLVDVNF